MVVVDVALIVFERNRLIRHREPKFSEGALTVLPVAVFLIQTIAGELFEIAAYGDGGVLHDAGLEDGCSDGDGRLRQGHFGIIVSKGDRRLKAAIVTRSIEIDRHRIDPARSQGLEKHRLVGGKKLAAQPAGAGFLGRVCVERILKHCVLLRARRT